MIGDLDQFQIDVSEWCIDAFGYDAFTPEQRAIRFLEEAIELYQSVGCDKEMAHKLVDYIFNRPAGSIQRELGGAGITLLSLAQVSGFLLNDMMKSEFDRVTSYSLDHFRQRNETKNAAGFKA